jgi:hypothetical protein
MKKKLLVLVICTILIATIPVAAGSIDTPIKKSSQTQNIFGWVIIRGMVFAWKEYGNEVHARAIRIHYRTWGPGEHVQGVVMGKEIIFKDRFAVDQIWSGPALGLFRWVFGIYHGEIEVR